MYYIGVSDGKMEKDGQNKSQHLGFLSNNIQGSPFITLCLGSIELDGVISEPSYKGIIL